MARNAVHYGVSNTNALLVRDANRSGTLKTYGPAGQPVACTLAQVLADYIARRKAETPDRNYL